MMSWNDAIGLCRQNNLTEEETYSLLFSNPDKILMTEQEMNYILKTFFIHTVTEMIMNLLYDKK